MRPFLALVAAALVVGCYRDLDFAPCQENPSNPVCFADAASSETGSSDTSNDVADTAKSCEDAGPSSESCGNCGTRTRTCLPDGTYGPWSACTGEGVCAPGTTEKLAAPACSSAFEVRSRTCTMTCAWSPDTCALEPGWHTMAVSPLDGRHHHAAVWDGKEMIVWGGEHPPSVLDDGATYDPKTNTWKGIATSPLSARKGASAVWTGSKMIVFGGVNDLGDSESDGAAYDPTTNTWKKIATGPLGARRDHQAVWTGKEMIVVGGQTPMFGPPTAASYDPIKDAWNPVPEPPISDLDELILAWVGTRVVAINGSLTAPAAATYDPAVKKWTGLPTLATARYHAGFAVTGTSLFLYGGCTAPRRLHSSRAREMG